MPRNRKGLVTKNKKKNPETNSGIAQKEQKYCRYLSAGLVCEGTPEQGVRQRHRTLPQPLRHGRPGGKPRRRQHRPWSATGPPSHTAVLTPFILAPQKKFPTIISFELSMLPFSIFSLGEQTHRNGASRGRGDGEM